MSRVRFLMVVVAMALVAAACGDAGTGATAPVGSGDAPGAAGACPVGQPDCNDTPGASAGGLVVDGGLTIPEALVTDATGTIAVTGYLFDDSLGWRLCEALAESFPPQCGGSALPLGNFDRFTVDDLLDDENITIQENQGTTWSESSVTFLGEIVDGTLMVDAGVAG